MMESSDEKGQPDWLMALALAVLIAAILAAPHLTTLDGNAYSTALHILHNQPTRPAEVVLGTIYQLPGIAVGGAAGVLAFLLRLPIVLGALSGLAAYGTLRYIGFNRLESAVAALLLLLAPPVYGAFTPGFVPNEMLAIPLTLLGMLSLALAAGYRKEEEMALGIGASALGLILFATSIWVYPNSAIVPLGMLVGYLLLASGQAPAKQKQPDALVWSKWAALALPLLMLAVRPPTLPGLDAAIGGLERLPGQAWMLLGFALIAIPAIWRAAAHPASRLFLALLGVGILAATLSPAMAIITLLLPAAYGIRMLSGLDEEVPVVRIAMVFLCLLAAIFGMLYGHNSQDPIHDLGLAGLGAVAGVALASLWGWDSTLVRHALAVFVLAIALFLAISYLPGQYDSDPYFAYKALDETVQTQLLNLSASDSGAPIATLAPADAIAFLSAKPSAGNQSQLVEWLMAPKTTPAPYAVGTRILLPITIFDTMSGQAQAMNRSWTMEAFHLAGTANSSGTLSAIYYTYSGLRIDHPIDSQNGGLAAERTYLYSLSGGNPIKIIRVGEVQLLYPTQDYDTPGNLLIWPNEELNSRLLSLYAADPVGVRVISRNADALVLEVI